MDDQQAALRKAVRSVLKQEAAASRDPDAFLARANEELTDVLLHAHLDHGRVVDDMHTRARLAAVIADVMPALRREFKDAHEG